MHRAIRLSNQSYRPIRTTLRRASGRAGTMAPRRFAPLDPAKRKEGDERPVLKGVVFDVDGTLCEFMPLGSVGSYKTSLRPWIHPITCIPFRLSPNPIHHEPTSISHNPPFLRRATLTNPRPPPELHVRRNALRPLHQQTHRHPRPHLLPPTPGARRSP
jgi:hypothetical protein